MACPAILTGGRFLASSLQHLDCQGRSIGAYGYGAMASPSSLSFAVLTSLLTLFVALFGIRMLLGYAIQMRDLVNDILKVGIVLTLATSWPAWRVIGYDLVIQGPTEVAQSIAGASGLSATPSLVGRLQNVDEGLVAMTAFGTGRLTGGVAGASDRGDSFHGIAIGDDTGFGWGRILFLSSTIGLYAVARLGSGILLALAPLMAPLLLFGQTSGLFAGWLKGLVFAFLANLSLGLVQGVELSILVPWINDALAQRAAGTFTPSAPTELVVLASSFLLLGVGLLALALRIAFFTPVSFHGLARFEPLPVARTTNGEEVGRAITGLENSAPNSRARTLSEAVAGTMRREQAGGFMAMVQEREAMRTQDGVSAGHPSAPVGGASGGTLGSSFRRPHPRPTQAAKQRDLRP